MLRQHDIENDPIKLMRFLEGTQGVEVWRFCYQLFWDGFTRDKRPEADEVEVVIRCRVVVPSAHPTHKVDLLTINMKIEPDWLRPLHLESDLDQVEFWSQKILKELRPAIEAVQEAQHSLKEKERYETRCLSCNGSGTTLERNDAFSCQEKVICRVCNGSGQRPQQAQAHLFNPYCACRVCVGEFLKALNKHGGSNGGH